MSIFMGHVYEWKKNDDNLNFQPAEEYRHRRWLSKNYFSELRGTSLKTWK